MTQYILGIAGTILLSCLVTMMLPTGRMHAFVRGILRLIILLWMISPLIGLLRAGSPYTSDVQFMTDERFLAACVQIIQKRDELAVKAHLLSEYSLSCQAVVLRNEDNSLQKITIVLPEGGISCGDGHINSIEEFERALASYYCCEVEIGFDQAMLEE